MEDCYTENDMIMTPLREGADVKETLGSRILGRVLTGDLKDIATGEVILPTGTLVGEKEAATVDNTSAEFARIRSVLGCEAKRGMCAKCYGRDLASGRYINVGEAVGVIAAQSIGEPGTQLTMRTFHFGGTVTHTVEKNTFESHFTGKVQFKNISAVVNRDGKNVVLSRSGEIEIIDPEGNLIDTYPVPYGSILTISDGDTVEAGHTLGEWDQFAVSIIAETAGKSKYIDLIEGQSLEERVDEATFLTRKVVTESKGTDLKPAIEITDAKGNVIELEKKSASYSLPIGAIIFVDDQTDVQPGDIIAKIPREQAKTKDITGGLPRVAELFEARKPKEMAVMADLDGEVSFGADTKGKRKVIITDEDGESSEYLIAKSRHVVVTEGDYIRKGEALVDGSQNPHDILAILGKDALSRYLVDEVQEVYRLQGVAINDKHIEVIVRQMLRRVKVIETGDTHLLPGEQIELSELIDVNRAVVAQGGSAATYEMMLLGITKASLSTDSWISAASFQETTKVLTEASIQSKVDQLRGLKENVIMGRLIPAGTGSHNYSEIHAKVLGKGGAENAAPEEAVAASSN
jgi:DNA-directed RNA polymerase subunit beta'